jgi:indole-3-glycerol phosphate synthase
MFIDDIVAAKRAELAEIKKYVPEGDLRRRAEGRLAPARLSSALAGEGIKLIAEVKKASPSKGVLCLDFDPVAMARAYAESGAATISVLTEKRYFQGSLDYLANIRQALGTCRPPLLRKDFIFEPYQIYESRAHGADCLLLIAAILDRRSLRDLLDLSHSLGMECLIEVHDERDLETAVVCGGGIIGINNRDLATFKMDIETTRRLLPLVPPGNLVVSESGIRSREDILRMAAYGANAVLVGEALVTAPDPRAKVRELVGQD